MVSKNILSKSSIATMVAFTMVVMGVFAVNTHRASAQCDYGGCVSSTILINDPGNTVTPVKVKYYINGTFPVEYTDLYNGVHHPGNYGSCLDSVTVTISTGQSITLPVGGVGFFGPVAPPPPYNTCVFVSVRNNQDNCHTVTLQLGPCP